MTRLLTARTAAVPVAMCRVFLGLAALVRGLKTGRDLYLLQFEPRAVPARLFDWAPEVATLPEMAVLTGLWLAASIALIIGYRARLAAFVVFLCAVFVHFVDMNFWAHHMYFLILMVLLISLTESDAMWSVRWQRDGRPVRDVTAWPVLLMKIQLSLVYFFTAVAKVNPVYLSGDVLLGRAAIPAILAGSPAIEVIAVATVAAEFFLSVGLWIRPLRMWALFVGVVLHGLIPIAMGPYAGLVTFSFATMGVYVLFFDGRDWRRFARWANRRVPALWTS
jgi:uncharacterized membrane protein YphA (DoxX/SURF4 family)